MRKIRKGQSGLSFMSGVTPSPPSTITQSIPSLQYFNFKFQLPSDSNVAMQTLDPNAMSTNTLQDTISKIVPQYNLQNPTEQQGQDFSFQLSSPESMLKQSVRDQSHVDPDSFSEKFANSTFGKNFEAWNLGLNLANTAFTDIFGEKDEYQGEKGDITQSMDSAYDTIQSAAGAFGPIGQFVSLGMGANKLLGNVANKLGGGTDGMTTTDAAFGSSFLMPIGIINGAFGKRTDTIYKNNQAFEQVGSSYTGTNALVDDAVKKSGKKYGLFSSGARKKANEQIGEANRQQNIVSDIADEATDRFNIRNSMAAINGNRIAYYLQGGYDQSSIRVGKSGMSIDLIKKAKEIASEVKKFQQGGKTEDPFNHYLSTLPEYQRDSTNFRVRDYWEYNGSPKDFDEAKKRGMFVWQEDFDDNGKSIGGSWHAFTIAKNPNADEYDFMKSPSHPTIQKEIDWYNSNDPEAIEFRKNYELQQTGPYWKYVRRQKVDKHKNGGQLSHSTEILLVEPELIQGAIDVFKEGGSINVIPDGALHARKHNMDMEGITPKGIPVVSDKDNGEVEQQAEIEKEEIIFRLEVTKKLEELEKKFYNDDTSQKEKDDLALEAGKLLVNEILYNTQDNTNNLL